MSFFNTLAEKASDIFDSIGTFVHNNASEIAVTTGVVATIAGTVYACVKTTEVPDILEEHKQAMTDIAEKHADDTESTTKEKIAVYAGTALKFAKTYWAPAAIYLIGEGLQIWGFSNMRDQRNSLAIAFSSLSATVSAYRARVASLIGEDYERDLYTGHPINIHDAEGNVVKRIPGPMELGDCSQYGNLPMQLDETWGVFEPGKPLINYYKAQGFQSFVTMEVRRHKFCSLNKLFQYGEHELAVDGQMWGFAPKEGQDYRTYNADFGIANIKMFENSTFGPPTNDTVDMCFNIVWLGDILPKKELKERAGNK